MGDPNLELDRLLCRAEPILLTLLRDNMLDSEDILDRDFFFLCSGWSPSSSRLHSRLDSLERRTRHEVRLPLDNHLTIKES